ncbi:MAG: 50S ribosomal protein L21 [Gammaproteobacteria bacterium]|nr:50S ribosomal protein L21 [Gammaproteobacteria bacterium]
MYAVIATGGKQYKVTEGLTLRVEKLEGDAGAAVDLDKVLMIADGSDVKIGTPYLDGSKVSATIKSQGRAKKVEIMKFRRRKHSQKRTGHRQYYTEIEITSIAG